MYMPTYNTGMKHLHVLSWSWSSMQYNVQLNIDYPTTSAQRDLGRCSGNENVPDKENLTTGRYLCSVYHSTRNNSRFHVSFCKFSTVQPVHSGTGSQCAPQQLTFRESSRTKMRSPSCHVQFENPFEWSDNRCSDNQCPTAL